MRSRPERVTGHTGTETRPRLVAFFVRYNSGSLSADGVPIQLFNLTQPNQLPIVLGTGLAYSEWLAWSPDSKNLAFIEGTDRIATMNKHLNLAEREGKVVPASQKEWVDTLPVWSGKGQEVLYFSRGKGTEYHYDPKKVMVPGQRIWKREENGEQKQVTQGTEQTADYYPTPSHDGTQLHECGCFCRTKSSRPFCAAVWRRPSLQALR